MNNRMPKSRGRTRYSRSTRKMRSAWKKRRPCTRRSGNKRRSTRRNTRMYGGRTNDPTTDEYDGEPIIKKAVITGSDGFYGEVKAAKAHAEYIDFQGPEQ